MTGPLTFTSVNWNVAQMVTVTPGNDDIVHAQSCTIGHAVTSADAAYDDKQLWPAHEWDGREEPLPLKALYFGAAGVI